MSKSKLFCFIKRVLFEALKFPKKNNTGFHMNAMERVCYINETLNVLM